jgi:hypothetical protein
MTAACDAHPKICSALPCENDQAKPDLFSRLARSTNCQRSLRRFRLSGVLLDRGPGCYARVSPNLLRSLVSRFDRVFRRFCANFLNLQDFHNRVKLGPFLCRGRSNSLLAVVPRLQISTGRYRERPHSETSRSAQYQRATDKVRLNPFGLTGEYLLGLAMACSLRVSQQRSRGACLT